MGLRIAELLGVGSLHEMKSGMDDSTKERATRPDSRTNDRVGEMARRMIEESISASGTDTRSDTEAVTQPEDPASPSPSASPPADVQVGRARTPADIVPVPDSLPDGHHDLTQEHYFLNRELTWLNFNFRVLHEAEDRFRPLPSPEKLCCKPSRTSPKRGGPR